MGPTSGSLKGDITVEEPSRHERSVARRSAEIRATVPHADFTRVLNLDAVMGAASTSGVAAFAYVLAAVGTALMRVPRLNGAYRDGHFELYSRVNVGVVIAADGIYAVPTVFDCDQKSVNDLHREVADLRERALADRLAPSELTGATFSVSDLEPHGLHAGAPLIIGGHAGALSAGAGRVVANVTDGRASAAHEMVISLATDHRMVQAPDAGRFLAVLAETLERA